MIDATQYQPGLMTAQATPARVAARPVFSMGQNDRMAGSVPVWGAPQTAQQKTMSRLGDAASERRFEDVLNDALAYSPTAETAAPNINDEPFGFGDIIDIINPLHHIPVIGTAYRAVTGDQIRPSSQIVGGAIFGGPAGAAGGLVNVLIAEETGDTVEGHLRTALIDPTPAQDDAAVQLAAAGRGQASKAPDSAYALGFAPGPVLGSAPAASRAVYRFNE